MTSELIATQYVLRRWRWAYSLGPGWAWPGEDILLDNGEVWFHPYDGREPVNVTKEYEYEYE